MRPLSLGNNTMANNFGPWATSIDAGGNPQLSTFWRRRLTMLVPASQTSPTLSQRNLLSLFLAGMFLCTLPTLRQASSSAMAAEEPAPAVAAKETNGDMKALEEFNKLYALKEGEVWKHVAPPFVSGRAVYYRTTSPSQAEAMPSGPDMMLFFWQAKQLKNWGMCFGSSDDLLDPLKTLAGIYPHEIEGDKELLKSSQIHGDWVFREGTPKKEAVAELERVLNKKCNLPVKLSLRDVKRKVIVAAGEFKFHPMPGHNGGIGIYIYDKEPETHGGGSGRFEKFVSDVSQFINTRIVSDLKNPPKDELGWYFGDSMPNPLVEKVGDRDVASVLKHVTEQTGITFKEDTRIMPVLFVERVK
jgi:hypothetical protein